jgi:hypothetical protein
MANFGKLSQSRSVNDYAISNLRRGLYLLLREEVATATCPLGFYLLALGHKMLIAVVPKIRGQVG